MTNPFDPDFRQPIWTDPVDDGLDWIRANYRFLTGCAISGEPPVLPGWQTSVDISTLNSYATPDKWILTKGSMRWEVRFAYTGSPLELDTTQVCYDNGVEGGLLCFDPVSLVFEVAAMYWNSDPLTSFDLVPFGSTATAAISFDGSDSSFNNNSAVRWKYSAQCTVIDPLVEGSFSTGQYLVMYDNITEIHGNESSTLFQLNGTYQPSTWVEADGALLRVLDQTANSPQLEGQVYSCDLHFAQNNGAGAPATGTIVTKPVTFISWADDDFITYDLFTDTNGTNLTAHTPDVDGVGTGWSVLAGGMEIATNRAVSSGGSPIPACMAVIDIGATDVAWRTFVNVFMDEPSLFGRVQDVNNYWQLKVEDTSTSDPVLKLIEVNSGTPTTRASVTMTGQGPLDAEIGRLMRLTFNGNDILGAFIMREGVFATSSETVADAVWDVTFTSTSFNTETTFGIGCTGEDAQFDSVFATVEECPWISYIDDN